MSSDTPSTPKASELKSNSSLDPIANESEKKPELYSETDIRRQINGKWRNVQNRNMFFSANFENDTFMIKWYFDNNYKKYTLGVKYSENDWTTSIENNTIVQRKYSDEKEWRTEFYIGNHKLQCVDYYDGKKQRTFTYERIGDPDPQ